MRTRILAGLLCVAAMSSVTDVRATDPINCPKDYEPFQVGEATAQFVRQCMGKPVHEDHNPDGRFVYVYRNKADHSRVTFLFDAESKLLNVSKWVDKK